MENTNAAAPVVKAPSKMALARPIVQEVTAEGAVLPEGCKTPRAAFISRAVAEIELTEKGAATYFQNLTKEAKGGPLYSRKAKKTEEVAAEEPAAAQDAEHAAEQPEDQATAA